MRVMADSPVHVGDYVIELTNADVGLDVMHLGASHLTGPWTRRPANSVVDKSTNQSRDTLL